MAVEHDLEIYRMNIEEFDPLSISDARQLVQIRRDLQVSAGQLSPEQRIILDNLDQRILDLWDKWENRGSTALEEPGLDCLRECAGLARKILDP